MKKIIGKTLFAIFGLVLFAIAVYFLIFGQDMISITNTTDQYMKAMSNRDSETAYSLLANRSKKISSVTLYEQFFLKDDESRYPYVGYENMCVKWIQFEPSITHEAVVVPPYGRTASIISCLYYKDQTKAGSATVFLEKENDNWRILGIAISAYPINKK